ncbi:hypothetical protein [Nocardia brasiliensis]|uniref:hypothetical protein n=1 Tax=Nocardia brasiliensis TaxID=37326 RepID=UPI003D936349
MPDHEHWYLAYERDVLGEPGRPWPTRPRSRPQVEETPRSASRLRIFRTLLSRHRIEE